MTNDLSRSRKRRASPVSKKDCACWPPPCSSPSPPSQAQRRSPWTCPTLQETTTTGANRHWAEARVQRNRWPILKKPARKVACGRLVPALPRNHARHFPRTSVPIFRHARKVACGRLVPALPRPHPRSRRPTLPRPHRPPAAPGHDFASQEFDCTGGLGSGDSELAVATVKKAPAGGKKRAKKAKPFSTPSTLARATCHTREKPWPDYGHLQNPDGTHGSPAMACDADLKIDPANGHLSLFIAPVTSHDAPCFLKTDSTENSCEINRWRGMQTQLVGKPPVGCSLENRSPHRAMRGGYVFYSIGAHVACWLWGQRLSRQTVAGCDIHRIPDWHTFT